MEIEPPGYPINHNREPNVEEPERRGITLRDIEAEDEGTLDCARTACLEDPFSCRCGIYRCRGGKRGRG